MKRGAVRDLAFVLAAEEQARRTTAAQIQAMRTTRRRRRRKFPPRDASEARHAKLVRALDRLQTDRILRAWKRDRQVGLNNLHLQRSSALARFDALTAGLKAEVKAARYQRDAQIRELTARKHDAVGRAEWRRDLLQKAEKLRNAGRQGWWGVREIDGSLVIRLRDRSGLIMLDPAESRERTAELIERLAPVLLECSQKGYEIHKAVFSEPNIPAGALKWGKEHIFKRFTQLILERDAKGQEIPRYLNVRHGRQTFSVPNPARKLPEIVAAFAVQEDPLARSMNHWNTHLNVVLVVDPGSCRPLDPELWPEDPEKPGSIKPDPAASVPGMFSYMKLAHTWGAQVEIRRLPDTPTDLRDSLLEVIKYSCKTVSEKSLEKFKSAAPLEDLPPQEFELTGDVCAVDVERPAPAMIDWPNARLIEWTDANKGFRRVRAWGVLYKLGKLERATNPDEGIRWLGRITVTPYQISVQTDFFGDSSSCWFNTGEQVPPSTGPPSAHQPRAGPPRT